MRGFSLCVEVFASAGNVLQARSLVRTLRNMFPFHRRRGAHPASNTALPCTGYVNEPKATQKPGEIARGGQTACSSFGQLEARRPRCGGRAGPGPRQFRASHTLTEPTHHSNSSESPETLRNGAFASARADALHRLVRRAGHQDRARPGTRSTIRRPINVRTPLWIRRHCAHGRCVSSCAQGPRFRLSGAPVCVVPRTGSGATRAGRT